MRTQISTGGTGPGLSPQRVLQANWRRQIEIAAQDRRPDCTKARRGLKRVMVWAFASVERLLANRSDGQIA